MKDERKGGRTEKRDEGRKEGMKEGRTTVWWLGVCGGGGGWGVGRKGGGGEGRGGKGGGNKKEGRDPKERKKRRDRKERTEGCEGKEGVGEKLEVEVQKLTRHWDLSRRPEILVEMKEGRTEGMKDGGKIQRKERMKPEKKGRRR
jgi:hypothetical protein